MNGEFNGNADDITSTGYVILGGGSTNTHGGVGSALFSFKHPTTSNYMIQVIFATSGVGIYIRTKINGTWEAWQKATLTSL